jgi:hypothetical protein
MTQTMMLHTCSGRLLGWDNTNAACMALLGIWA